MEAFEGYKPDEYNIDHVNNGKLIFYYFIR